MAAMLAHSGHFYSGKIELSLPKVTEGQLLQLDVTPVIAGK